MAERIRMSETDGRDDVFCPVLVRRAGRVEFHACTLRFGHDGDHSFGDEVEPFHFCASCLGDNGPTLPTHACLGTCKQCGRPCECNERHA